MYIPKTITFPLGPPPPCIVVAAASTMRLRRILNRVLQCNIKPSLRRWCLIYKNRWAAKKNSKYVRSIYKKGTLSRFPWKLCTEPILLGITYNISADIYKRRCESNICFLGCRSFLAENLGALIDTASRKGGSQRECRRGAGFTGNTVNGSNDNTFTARWMTTIAVPLHHALEVFIDARKQLSLQFFSRRAKVHVQFTWKCGA